jgi:hypothetical protein
MAGAPPGLFEEETANRAGGTALEPGIRKRAEHTNESRPKIPRDACHQCLRTVAYCGADRDSQALDSNRAEILETPGVGTAETPPVPDIADRGWLKQSNDVFVAKHLNRKLCGPEPPPRRKLGWDLSLELTGLPPSPQEVDSFLQAGEGTRRGGLYCGDGPPAGIARYGERTAMDWLDAARYADPPRV